MSVLLVKGGDLYDPQPKGVKDVLLVNEKIFSIADEISIDDVKKIDPDASVIDAGGCVVVPGLIDQHNHFNGAGGEGGPHFRTPPVQLSTFVRAGITTAVGLLGTDGLARSLTELLAKSRALEIEGLSTWIYTGSYQIPSPTMTGSLLSDMTLIDKVIGVKMALSDHRSSHPSVQELRRLASDARVAGMLNGKAGVLCIHMGSEETGLKPILDAVEGTEIPLAQFAPTHLSRTRRLFDEAVEFVLRGGYADITAGKGGNGGVSTVECMDRFRKAGADLGHVTISSDGNGSMPKFNEKKELIGMGVGSPNTLLEAIRDCTSEGTASFEDILAAATANVARHLCLPGKGELKAGFDGDLLVLESGSYLLRHVVARGEALMMDGEVIKRGTFE